MESIKLCGCWGERYPVDRAQREVGGPRSFRVRHRVKPSSSLGRQLDGLHLHPSGSPERGCLQQCWVSEGRDAVAWPMVMDIDGSSFGGKGQGKGTKKNRPQVNKTTVLCEESVEAYGCFCVSEPSFSLERPFLGTLLEWQVRSLKVQNTSIDVRHSNRILLPDFTNSLSSLLTVH